MPKVENTTDKTISVLRWKVLPDGRIISPMGAIVSEMPNEVAYSPQVKHLADQGYLVVPGYSRPKQVPVPDIPEEEPEELMDSESDSE
jgi:hypothetical protein